MPLAHASTLDRAAQLLPHVVVEAFWSPALVSRCEKRRQKQPSSEQRQLPRHSGRGPFSLRRGLDSVLGLLQAEHHLVRSCRLAFKRRRRPSRVAHARAAMRL